MKSLLNLSVRTKLALVTIFVPLASLGIVGSASAATQTWSGNGADGNWSTVGNWVSGVAPVNGDDVVIDNSAKFTNGSKDDIALLTSINSLKFINNSSSGGPVVSFGHNITITAGITQDATVTNTANAIQDNGSSVVITLGANAIITSGGGGLTLGTIGQSDSLVMGNNLTFTDNGGTTANITAIYIPISGNGTVTFNGGSTDYQLHGANTYSGTTIVQATNLPIAADGTAANDAFGTSAITIGNGGAIDFQYNGNATINNAITITGTANGSPVTSLGFGSTANPTTLTVPKITLNGSTRIANDNSSGQLTVNLAGITSNGYCIEYLGGSSYSDGPGNGFTNGPAGCIVSGTLASTTGGTATPAPKTPNTGFGLISTNVWLPLAGAIMVGSGLYIFSRKFSSRSTINK